MALTKTLTKYSNFLDIFSEKEALMLLEQIGFNQHAIKLRKDKQPLYGLIYIVEPVELET